MKPTKLLWYVLIPEKQSYFGPFTDEGVLKLLVNKKLNMEHFIWSPSFNHENWKMIVECSNFHKMLRNPKWLFSLPEEQLLNLHRIINGKPTKKDTRQSWYETLRTSQTLQYNQEEVTSPVDLIPVPKRSERYTVEQSLSMHIDNGDVHETNTFIVSKNGVYLSIAKQENIGVGGKLSLTTVDHINQQPLQIEGLVTSETETTAGKNLGIRFLHKSKGQKSLIENWIKTLAA